MPDPAPAHQLLLKVARDVPSEIGFGFTHVPGDVRANLIGDFDIEPFTGFACPRTIFGSAVAWPALSNFATSYAFVAPGPTYLAGVARTATGTWSITASTSLVSGQGFLLGFLNYAGRDSITVDFSNRFRLVMDAGRVALSSSGSLVRFGDLWSNDEWTNGVLWLHVYSVGEQLCVRRWRSDKGFSAWVGGRWGTGQALEAGQVTVSGDGFSAFCLSLEGHDTSFWLQHAVMTMLHSSTASPTIGLLASQPSWATLTGQVLTTLGVPVPGTTPTSQFYYRVEGSLALATGPNLYVGGVRVRFAPVYVSDGSSSADVISLLMAEHGIVEELSRDPKQHQVSFTLGGADGLLDAYHKGNMKGIWLPNGTQRAVFFTGDLGFRRTTRNEYVEVVGQTGWKRLQTTPWTGGAGYGGWTLGAAYADVLSMAGLSSADYSISGGAYELPREAGDDRPIFDFNTEQTVEDVLLYLHDHFGPDQLMRWKADGKLYIEDAPTSIVQVGGDDLTFYFTTPAIGVLETGRTAEELPVLVHVAHGTSTYPRIMEWDPDEDEEEYFNQVTVIGYDPAGNPLAATATDWPAINDESSARYFGDVKRLIVIDAGLTTQAVVNWVCRQIYDQVYLRRQKSQFKSVFLAELLAGELVAIDGEGTWRLESLRTTWDKHGRQGLTRYEVVKVA